MNPSASSYCDQSYPQPLTISTLGVLPLPRLYVYPQRTTTRPWRSHPLRHFPLKQQEVATEVLLSPNGCLMIGWLQQLVLVDYLLMRQIVPFIVKPNPVWGTQRSRHERGTLSYSIHLTKSINPVSRFLEMFYWQINGQSPCDTCR